MVADVAKGAVDSTAIAFRLAPRINAAGRLEHAMLAYDLLRTHDPVTAFNQAKMLEELNQRRRSLTDAAQSRSRAAVGRERSKAIRRS